MRRLAAATRAAYDHPFDRDDCRAPTTGFFDDCCSAGRVSGSCRGGHLLRTVRPLRQRCVSQHGLADRSQRSRRTGAGRVASARRIPVGDGFRSLLTRHVRLRSSGFQDAFARRNPRRFASRKLAPRPGNPKGTPRLEPGACGALPRSVRTRKFQVVPVGRGRGPDSSPSARTRPHALGIQ